MIAKRIIPVVLAKQMKMVKGEKFNNSRSVGVTLQATKIYQAREVDELMILNVDGGKLALDLLRDITDGCFMPITVGGGIKNLADATEYFYNGADKICVGTAGIKNKSAIEKIASTLGSQALCVSVDCKIIDNKYIVTYNNGKGITNISPVDHAIDMVNLGAGEILINNVDRDGTMSGYDLGLIKSIAEAVTVPVIACGGCSGFDDMVNAINAGADAVAASALFQFTDATPKQAAIYMNNAGIETRI